MSYRILLAKSTRLYYISYKVSWISFYLLSLLLRVSILGSRGFSPSLSRGTLSGGILSRGILSGGVLSGGILSGGTLLGGVLSGGIGS